MKRRRTDRLTEEDYEGIVEWLEGRPEKWDCDCPFTGLIRCETVCRGIFPQLDVDNACPCHRYSDKYIREVARKVLKEAKYEV